MQPGEDPDRKKSRRAERIYKQLVMPCRIFCLLVLPLAIFYPLWPFLTQEIGVEAAAGLVFAAQMLALYACDGLAWFLARMLALFHVKFSDEED